MIIPWISKDTMNAGNEALFRFINSKSDENLELRLVDVSDLPDISQTQYPLIVVDYGVQKDDDNATGYVIDEFRFGVNKDTPIIITGIMPLDSHYDKKHIDELLQRPGVDYIDKSDPRPHIAQQFLQYIK